MNLTSIDPFSLAITLGVIALLPLILTVCTSYLKISMVLTITRNAIGVQQVPPAMALHAIALVMTVFVMAPTLQQVWVAMNPDTTAGRQAPKTAIERFQLGAEPMRAFMLKHSRPEQRDLFLDTAKKSWPAEMAKQATNQDFMILVPAFVVSELQIAFQIGFLMYLPFVVIDLLVSNVLQALGMSQVSPQTIGIPLKILLFVMVDGWGKLLHGLVQAYL